MTASPCTWSGCLAPANVSVDFWLFSGPIDYCRPHSERFVAELQKLGAGGGGQWHGTGPDPYRIVVAEPRGTRPAGEKPLAAEMLALAGRPA